MPCKYYNSSPLYTPKFPRFHQLGVGQSFMFKRRSARAREFFGKIEPEWSGDKVVNAIGRFGKTYVGLNTPTIVVRNS